MTQRVIKFRAWHNGAKAMLQVGDDHGTTHPLDCALYARQGQDVILMQFTGKVDKNGTELYEGDIYRYSYEYDSDYDGDMPIVKTSTGVAVIKDIFDTYWIKRAKEEGGTVERIGDIYTTPELVDPKMIER